MSILDAAHERFVAPDARVLLADDVSMNLKVFAGLLKETKIQIDTAVNGEEALKLIESRHYDVIFLDHMMPVLDGIETFRRMKKMAASPNAETPVVMLTANAVVDAKSRYMEEGFSAYVAKPIREEVLLSTLKKFLPKELVQEVRATETAKVAVESADKAAAGSAPQVALSAMLDKATGLAYCMNDQNFYNEMLDEYVKCDKTDELVEYFEKGDFEYYRITVHAVKSTSLTIGAKKLSEDAKALEKACKENNLDFVKANHGAFLEEYAKLIRELRAERGL